MKKRNIRLPETVRVCGVDIAIEYPYELDDNLVGLSEYVVPSIKLADCDMTDKMLLSVFFHEVLHFVDYFYLDDYICDKVEEDGIKLFEVILFGIILDNKNKLFIEKIPKVVKIFGSNTTVSYSDFSDTYGKRGFRSNSRKELIELSSCVKSAQAVSQNLILAIIFYVVSRLQMDIELTQLTIFGRGIYQVFIDNNLMELFKEVV